MLQALSHFRMQVRSFYLPVSGKPVYQNIRAQAGTAAFYPQHKKVQLTPAGALLLKHVEPAMNLISRGESQLLESGSLGLGQLHIGASDTICRYFLVPYLNKFHKLYPNVHIKVTNSTSIDCARILENGQVDFIITNYPNSGLLNTHSVRAIREFRDVFVASADHFPLQDKTFTLAELLDYPIMMLDRKSTTSEFLHSMFQKSHLDLVPEIELSSNDLLIDLARIGLGIAFVPDFCIPKDESSSYLKALRDTSGPPACCGP